MSDIALRYTVYRIPLLESGKIVSSIFDPNLACDTAYPPTKGRWRDNLLVYSVPWRFCNCYGFLLVFENPHIRQIKSS